MEKDNGRSALRHAASLVGGYCPTVKGRALHWRAPSWITRTKAFCSGRCELLASLSPNGNQFVTKAVGDPAREIEPNRVAGQSVHSVWLQWRDDCSGRAVVPSASEHDPLPGLQGFPRLQFLCEGNRHGGFNSHTSDISFDPDVGNDALENASPRRRKIDGIKALFPPEAMVLATPFGQIGYQGVLGQMRPGPVSAPDRPIPVQGRSGRRDIHLADRSCFPPLSSSASLRVRWSV